jgi:hypothetical protein
MYILHLLLGKETINEGSDSETKAALDQIRAVLGFRARLDQQRLRKM